MASDNSAEYVTPFIEQGITCFLGGNCGFGVAGMKKCSVYKKDIRNGLFAPGIDRDVMPWDSWSEFYEYATVHGIRANLATLAGHGTALASVAGLLPPKRGFYSKEETAEVHALLEQAMDDGCKGVSLGLSYRPGINIGLEQIADIAKLVSKRGKILTVHRAVERNDAPKDAEPSNVRWLRSFLDMALDVGVRVEISHLVFPWRNAWHTFDAVLELLDDYITKGLDVFFDMFPYSFGASEIAITLPPDLAGMVPRIYTDKSLQAEVAEKLQKRRDALGQRLSDIQLANPAVPELMQYKGMFLDEIAESMGMSDLEANLEIYRRTNGAATVYMYAHYGPGQIERLMCHPNVLYMTDDWIEKGCGQNPSAFGAMPKFIRLAGESGNLTLEEVISRMTAKTAHRFDIKERGEVREGYYADLIVFHPDTISDVETADLSGARPVGVEHVFINGSHVVEGGAAKPNKQAGMIITK
jgi:N-acyl-D-amino-acid deacylase